MAKLVNVLSSQPEKPMEYVERRTSISAPSKPLIAIPTTTGSGSEATHFAVIYVGNKKYSLAHDSILPTISIVDPVNNESATDRLLYLGWML